MTSYGEMRNQLAAEMEAWIEVRRNLAKKDAHLQRLSEQVDAQLVKVGPLIDRAERALDAYLADLNRFYAEDVEAFRKRIAAAGLELMPGVEELRR